MQQMQLAKVDLNLLPSLAVLLEERSVSRAAEAVGLSQSAMSRSLGRLRRLLQDELLIRSGDGYRLTPGAQALRLQLGEVLPHLQSMFLEREADPSSETRQFRMAGSDYAVTTFGVALFSDILDAAPSASVRFVPWHSDILQSLTDGEVDLVFSGMRAASPFVSDLLFTDDMVCVVDRNHPLAHRDSITLDQYLASGHLIIDIDRGQQPSVDGVLAAMGRARAGTLTVPFHATAPLALADTQLILTMPARALHHYVTPRGEKLCVFPAPLQVKSLPYFMTWHSRVTHDKSHQWLRERVRHAIENNPEAR